MSQIDLSPGSSALLRIAASGDGRIVMLGPAHASDKILVAELLDAGCIVPASAGAPEASCERATFLVTERGYAFAWD